jgi:multisubunit Na+/H+ antiporter MnhB subunit
MSFAAIFGIAVLLLLLGFVLMKQRKKTRIKNAMSIILLLIGASLGIYVLIRFFGFILFYFFAESIN